VGPVPTLSTTFVLNDQQFQVDLDPRATLADAVRASGATGTRVGCEEGVCGSCTVLVDDRPTRACLMLAAQADGRRVRTIEGLAVDGVLHPVQQAFRDERALQCGFCTTGFVMLAVGLLEDEPDASPERITEVLSSNLCRCTGYASIVDAVAAAQRSITAATP
jgi:carbon-monoxide dehydrogenase small subunit